MTGDYYGQPARAIDNEHLRLEFLTEAGPRLVRLYLAGSGENLLAETPQLSSETPFGTFHMWGGHRLWHSPEVFPRTYIPDDRGLMVEDLPAGVRLSGPVEQASGIRKSIVISLHPYRPALTLLHTLVNENAWPVELAPWAITQLPLGGILILPQCTSPLDKDGLLPNRQLVLWPYTSWQDPRLQLRDDFIFIQAQAKLPPVKIGYLNRQGWIAYLQSGVLFCKRFQPQLNQIHPDFNCNAECYCNDEFIEMETLGPLARLEPGQALNHTETWEFYPGGENLSSIDEVRSYLSNLNL